MAGGIEQVRNNARRSDNRQIIRSAGTKPDARAAESCCPGLGSDVTRRLEQVSHAGYRCTLIEPGFFHRCSNENGAVVPRNEIALGTPDDTAQPRARPDKMQQLTAHRSHRHPSPNAFDSDSTGPTSCGKNDCTSVERSAIDVDDDVPVRGGETFDLILFDERSSIAPRCCRSRTSEFGGSNEAVVRNEKPPKYVSRQMRLLCARCICFEERCADAATSQYLSSCLQHLEMLLLGRNVQGSITMIVNGNAAIGLDSQNERIEKVETPHSKWQQRTRFIHLEVWGQYSGGRLSSAHPNGSSVNNPHRTPTASKLVGDSTPDDSRADNDNVKGLPHGSAI